MSARIIFSFVFLLFSSTCYVGAHEKTSITDDDQYLDFCLKATEKDEVFEDFKSSGIIENVMQHVSYAQGYEFCMYILDHYPFLLEYMDKFRENDEVGNPVTYNFPELGKCSGTNLRYIKVAGDIFHLFGDLREKEVVEIGCGYGGQAKILYDLYEDLNYTLVDLPAPLALTKKYLELFTVKNFSTKTMAQLPDEAHYDIVISNYAFSECSMEIQQEYINKVISKSNMGYMLYNKVGHNFGIVSYSVYQFSEILHSLGYEVQVVPEQPNTFSNNCLVTWNRISK